MTIERVFPNSEPDIVLDGFRLWVHRRGHPQATNLWDANWLEITASYVTKHCIAVCEGNVLHGSDVLASLDSARRMYETLEGELIFATLDPGFRLLFTAQKYGQLDLDIRIVTEELGNGTGAYNRRHSVDQSYLPALIKGLTRVLSRFPIVGNAD